LASLPRSVLVPEGNLRILKFHVGPIEINSQTFYPTGLTTTGRVSFSVLRIVNINAYGSTRLRYQLHSTNGFGHES